MQKKCKQKDMTLTSRSCNIKVSLYRTDILICLLFWAVQALGFLESLNSTLYFPFRLNNNKCNAMEVYHRGFRPLNPWQKLYKTTVEESRYTLTNWDQSQSWKICRDSTFSIRMLWNLSKQPLYLQRWAAGIAQKLPGRSKTHSRWGLNR
jgi:hypothetical protein